MKINGRTLELRPWCKSYQVQSEMPEGFECSDYYYIGMRIRRGVEIKKENVDLSATRRLFFDRLLDQLDQNAAVEQLIADGQSDIRVDYRTRDLLPVEVRPDPRQAIYNEEVGGKRAKVE